MQLNNALAEKYVSASQKARVVTENWVANNLFCPVCGHDVLTQYEANKPVGDFFCGKCMEDFELKSKECHKSFTVPKKIMDGAYETMIRRITSMQNPHLFFMSYMQQHVLDLMFVPKFFFVPGIIVKRNPLTPKARRAGWVGCNIDISLIPKTGKIHIIQSSVLCEPQEVVALYNKALSLKMENIESRGWLLDVLGCVEQLDAEFSLSDIYQFSDLLAEKHSDNHNIKPKIRQQLQILRDKGFIDFMTRGKYMKL